MKILHIILFVLGVLFIGGCEKNTNNFDYQQAEVITVEGLEPSYTLMSGYDVLNIDISANSTIPAADFDYTWGVYETNVQGYAPKLDTIGKGSKLVYPIKLPAKGWMLVLMAKNKTTGVTQYLRSNLNIVTMFTRGWYVAKSEGDSTDLDLHLTPDNISTTTLEENVLSLSNGKKLAGRAKQLIFTTNYKTTVTGVLANTRTLFVQSEKSSRPLNINTLKSLHTDESLFIGTPPPGSVGAAFNGSSANYLIKGGKLFSIYAMSSNNGTFGSAKMIDEYDSPYNLSDYFAVNTSNDPILWDNISGSFITMSMGYGTSMAKYIDAQTNNDIKANNNNNKNLLYMGFKSAIYNASAYRYALEGYALLQDKVNQSLKTLVKLVADQSILTITPTDISSTSLLHNATMYTLNKEDESILYFVTANQVYSHNLDNHTEDLQFSTPNDEEVTFIRHLKYSENSNPVYSHNYIAIGSKKGNEYRIRFFKKSSGNLESQPVFTLEGKGTANDVLYISPSVSEYTYANSY
ncbi:PKD-like family lipoprotein [Sphingobacterium paucimobilis]|uniref:PKD-like family protein n=1 Tax=Sphingobacterium paucimobilis HER1398 TaxID=1346330 RepID=U2HEE1_9SPHI|nr:PKD-like family lipoprotein [Sphingobacterium paucimobilis]ERJ60121.1 hypothetical protein M472_15255 [Sphingobacterium paucimobilis HER1398]